MFGNAGLVSKSLDTRERHWQRCVGLERVSNGAVLALSWCREAQHANRFVAGTSDGALHVFDVNALRRLDLRRQPGVQRPSPALRTSLPPFPVRCVDRRRVDRRCLIDTVFAEFDLGSRQRNRFACQLSVFSLTHYHL